MASQYKTGENGTGSDQVNVVAATATATAGERRRRNVELVLRLLGLAFTLVAAVVVGVDKEAKIIPINFFSGMPAVEFHVIAKYKYLSALVYFVVSNSIACSYAASSLVLTSTVTGHKKNGLTLMLITLDLLMLGLLFSANGAAFAIGVISRDGNSHVEWRKVCYLVNKYCNHIFGALVLSLFGSFVFLCLVLLAALNLYKKSK